MNQKSTFAPEQEFRPIVLRPLHGAETRLEEAVPVGPQFQPGRFGRMFPMPLRSPASNAALTELAEKMLDPTPDDPAANNVDVPGGFTYFGQFVDHDITFDPTPVPEKLVDPTMIHNFRTPKLDLDSVYGLGPAVQPYLYHAGNRAKLLIGTNAPSNDQNNQPINLPEGGYDLPRNGEGTALIGDPRNDENLIVAQLHLAFLKFHNAVADMVDPDPKKQEASFVEIRRLVTWHYQWIVLHDFIKRLVQPTIFQDVCQNPRKFFKFDKEPFIPVEFSVGAYRFGHSLIRNSYDHNRVFGPGDGRLANGTLDLLFFFTGPRKEQGPLISTPLPSNWVIDWRRFFEIRGSKPQNTTRLIDTRLASALQDLMKVGKVDHPPTSLAERNLRRGEKTALPTGQNVAGKMEIPCLDPDDIANGPEGDVLKKHGLHKETPLWFYILKEASLQEGGKRLGQVGSRIVTEVFVGLLDGDPLSFRSQSPKWKPTLGTDGTFTIADMLSFIDKSSPILNPIGD